MKRLILKRVSSAHDVTYGVLIDAITGYALCVTLEEPWKFNRPMESCIYPGVFTCVPTGNSRGQFVFRLQDITGRSGVDIHVGNNTNDIEGCILVGSQYGYDEGKQMPCVFSSGRAFKKLRRFLEDEKFILEIESV